MDPAGRGKRPSMTEPNKTPNLDDVLDVEEVAQPDRHEHAKTPHPPHDDELERRAQQERERLGADGPIEP